MTNKKIIVSHIVNIFSSFWEWEYLKADEFLLFADYLTERTLKDNNNK